jgi:hypothetical protein
MRPARPMDWVVIRQFAEEDIITGLQASPEFVSALNLREQYFHVRNILHTQHQPAFRCSTIARLFRLSKAIV